MSKDKSKKPQEGGAAAAERPKGLDYASLDTKYIVRITGILLAICAVTALLLGEVNQITKPLIDAIQKEKNDAAMAAVLPADEYVAWEGELPEHVTALYLANAGGEAAGWVAATTTSGSQGAIDMMVGVDADGKVTGVSVVKHSETPNIGTKVVSDQSVLDRFVGMSHANGEITVNSGDNRFDGVTGATYSSKGVAAGVNAALDAVGALS